jgi:hypothetical protein
MSWSWLAKMALGWSVVGAAFGLAVTVAGCTSFGSSNDESPGATGDAGAGPAEGGDDPSRGGVVEDGGGEVVGDGGLVVEGGPQADAKSDGPTPTLCTTKIDPIMNDFESGADIALPWTRFNNDLENLEMAISGVRASRSLSSLKLLAKNSPGAVSRWNYVERDVSPSSTCPVTLSFQVYVVTPASGKGLVLTRLRAADDTELVVVLAAGSMLEIGQIKSGTYEALANQPVAGNTWQTVSLNYNPGSGTLKGMLATTPYAKASYVRGPIVKLAVGIVFTEATPSEVSLDDLQLQ